MIQPNSDPKTISIIVNNSDTNTELKESPLSNDAPPNYCLCKTELCQCGSKLGVTEANVKAIYSHLGFPGGRETMVAEGYRMDALHVWGTHDLSTKDILEWLEEYSPKGVEWIDDSSCNVLLNDENTLLRILNKLSEPFDRRIALAAMAAIVSTMGENGQSGIAKSPKSAGLPLCGTTDNLLPPNGRWFKSVSSPERAFCLYFRIAHKGDVKLPGAERRSNYYRRYGNPNYGGAVGLLSRSYRRRVKAVTPTTDTRYVNIANSRQLVSYDEIDVDLHGLAMHLQRGSSIIDSDEGGCSPRPQNLSSGQRREAAASGLSNPPRNPPPKWPRRSSSGFSSLEATVFRPPVSQSTLNFDFGRLSAKQRLGNRNTAAAPPLATVTILPEDSSGSLRMLTSLRMVADLEEEAAKARYCLRSDNIFNQPGPTNPRPTYCRRRVNPRGASRSGGSGGGVWNRLG